MTLVIIIHVSCAGTGLEQAHSRVRWTQASQGGGQRGGSLWAEMLKPESVHLRGKEKSMLGRGKTSKKA